MAKAKRSAMLVEWCESISDVPFKLEVGASKSDSSHSINASINDAPCGFKVNVKMRGELWEFSSHGFTVDLILSDPHSLRRFRAFLLDVAVHRCELSEMNHNMDLTNITNRLGKVREALSKCKSAIR